MSDAPRHPRDSYHLVGHAEAEAAFLDALGRGRLHHAWMLVGPEGVGKATFAYRVARKLLGGQGEGLDVPASDPVSRMISAEAHPDLMVIERVSEGGRLRKSISVDQMRELPGFFAKSPSMGGARVAIIDAIDDANVNSANALLKSLEEPPEKGVILLVCHSPGSVLDTIRSRCRKLTFRPMDSDTLIDWLADAGVERHDARELARLSRGAPGAALSAQARGLLELDALAAGIVEGTVSPSEVLAHSDQLRRADGQTRFEDTFALIQDHIRTRAVSGSDGARLSERWAALWTEIGELRERALALNLDRGEVFQQAVARIRTLAPPS
ncbi:MAG: DNA polymerase III subunit delta' [Brevundimonas sp.]|jgi:DNA polymerase III subunit delta'|uniref:DNA polymerase III subunit delta' n=1 Tax=Brevundimonas sp. TaxID=1871086 RepID=UPI00391940E4